MNPATDAGKRRLPEAIRAVFTEFAVVETKDDDQLAQIVRFLSIQITSISGVFQ